MMNQPSMRVVNTLPRWQLNLGSILMRLHKEEGA
jgi:hypothetical protein